MIAHHLPTSAFELTSHLRPREALLDQTTARFAERLSAFRISKERDDLSGEVYRSIRYREVLAGLERQTFRPDSRRYHGFCHRQSFEDLQPGSAADPEGHDVDCRLLNVRAR